MVESQSVSSKFAQARAKFEPIISKESDAVSNSSHGSDYRKYTENTASWEDNCSLFSIVAYLWGIHPNTHQFWKIVTFVCHLLFLLMIVLAVSPLAHQTWKMTYGVISDLIAGTCYLILWDLSGTLMSFGIIERRMFNHGLSWMPFISGLILMIYTFVLDFRSTLNSDTLDLDMEVSNRGPVEISIMYTFNICNIYIGTLARSASLWVLSIGCIQVEKYLLNLQGLLDETVVPLRTIQKKYINQRSRFIQVQTYLASVLHTQIVFESIFRGFYLFAEYHNLSDADKVLQILNFFILLQVVVPIFYRLARLQQLKEDCVTTALASGQKMHLVGLVKKMPLPTLFGFELSYNAIARLLTSLVTIGYGLINLRKYLAKDL